MKSRLRIVPLLFVLGFFLASSPAYTQDREQALERILNPMPDYDPFEKSPVAAPPQYFPDAVDKRARDLLIDALTHREDALRYALRYGRDLDAKQADQFVGMYVNDWTLDFGLRGRQAVAEFLAQGHTAGVLPELVVPEFVK